MQVNSKSRKKSQKEAIGQIVVKIVNYMTSIKYCNQVDGWSMLLEIQTDRTEAGFKQTDQKKKVSGEERESSLGEQKETS